jgi:nicotinamidase-related amidase
MLATSRLQGESVELELRRASGLPRRGEATGGGPRPVAYRTERATWDLSQTAVVVCDTWDLHHCLNAVRRLEEFAPRIDALVAAARDRGATIIHAPSDCLPAYAGHPARQRAERVPRPADLPPHSALWCSRLPQEAEALYPIDQSDGGEDDDPTEHAEWAASLRAKGRNPGTPWKTQSPLVRIDAERDYLTDRGDEALAILKQRGIRHVLMTGVHTNMCVLGRPFGIRRLVAAGFDVALVRDLTDSMYNPRAWPYVDHFTGHELVVAYVEQYLCPTVTSDAVLGGEPARSKFDRRPAGGVLAWPEVPADRRRFERHWTRVELPMSDWSRATAGVYDQYRGPAWYRCAVVIPRPVARGLVLELPQGPPAPAVEARTLPKGDTQAGGRERDPRSPQGWLNGEPLAWRLDRDQVWRATLPDAAVTLDEANLLVVRLEHGERFPRWSAEARLVPAAPAKGTPQAKGGVVLRGGWQFRLGDNLEWKNIPLPAKFGAAADMVFEWPAL